MIIALFTPILVSTVALAVIAIAAGFLIDSLSRYDRTYRLGFLQYRKIIIDGEPTYCFQVRTTYRYSVTAQRSAGTTIATTK